MNTTLKRTFEVYVFVFAFLFASRPLSDGDFWWHLKTGEYIVRNFSIPRIDFYSFTVPGRHWVAHEWLSEVIFYLVYSRAGFNTLIFIFTIFTVLAFWIVFQKDRTRIPLSKALQSCLAFGAFCRRSAYARARSRSCLRESISPCCIGLFVNASRGRSGG